MNPSVATYLHNALAVNTVATYHSGWSSYSRFCESYNIPRLPATQTNLVYYFTSLANRLILHSTMKVYLSAIAYHSQLLGFPLELKHMHQLHYLLRGIRRIQGAKLTKPRRLPVSLHHLSALHVFLSNRCTPHDARMLWAAITIAFFGLLRSSEYTCPSHNTQLSSTLLTSHVVFASDYSHATLHLPFSKTDQFGVGTTVELFALQSPLCPVSALAHFLAVRNQAPGPLFIFRNGAFLTRDNVVSVLREAFPAQANINTHSFRIGGASALAVAGVPEYIIQILGRWSSDSFLRYIHIPSTTIRNFQRQMVAPASL